MLLVSDVVSLFEFRDELADHFSYILFDQSIFGYFFAFEDEHHGVLFAGGGEFLIEGGFVMAVGLTEKALDTIAVGGVFEIALGNAKGCLRREKGGQGGLQINKGKPIL